MLAGLFSAWRPTSDALIALTAVMHGLIVATVNHP